MIQLIKFILGGDAKPLEEAGKKGQKSLADLKKEYRDNINTGAKWTAGLVAAGTAIVVHLINNAREAIDVQRALALQFNQTVATMATLERASDLTGVAFDKITASSKILDQNIGKAAQGAEAEAAVFKRLGLEAQALADLPLDERILKINDAIRENIPAVERAAVAAELFGAKNAQAMALLSPEDIQAAREETELFGHALSEVDATAVDNANDSFSRIQMAQEGLFKQLAVQLSPMIQQIGEDFTNAAKEAGGMESIAKKITDELVTGFGFAADAVEGFRRVVLYTGNSIALFVAQAKVGFLQIAETIVSGPIDALNKLIDLTNFGDVKDPGLSQPQFVQDLQKELDEAKRVSQEGMDAIHKILHEPLPSENFKVWVDQAREASAQAAQAAVDARAAIAGDDEDGGSIIPFDKDQMNELQKSIEEMKKTAVSAMSSTRTEVESANAELEEFQHIVDVIGKDSLASLGVNAESVITRLRANVDAAANEEFADLQDAIDKIKGEAMATFESTQTDIEKAAEAMVDFQRIINTVGNETLLSWGINSKQVMASLIKDVEDAKLASEDAFGGMGELALEAGRNIQNELASVFKGTEANWSQMLRNMAAEWASSQLLKMGMNWMAGSSNAGIAAAGASLLKSFDGGGWTGNGPRSGGIDGKGGFLSVMHPREVVTDMTKARSTQNMSSGDINIGGLSISLPGVTRKEDAGPAATTAAREFLAQLQFAQRRR